MIVYLRIKSFWCHRTPIFFQLDYYGSFSGIISSKQACPRSQLLSKSQYEGGKIHHFLLCSQDSIPASTLLLGDTSDSTSNSLAQRLGMDACLLLLFFNATLRDRLLLIIAGKECAFHSCCESNIFATFSLAGNEHLSCLFVFIASKTKKQIFVSYNIKNTDSGFILLVENRIKEEMTAFPEKF